MWLVISAGVAVHARNRLRLAVRLRLHPRIVFPSADRDQAQAYAVDHGDEGEEIAHDIIVGMVRDMESAYPSLRRENTTEGQSDENDDDN